MQALTLPNRLMDELSQNLCIWEPEQEASTLNRSSNQNSAALFWLNNLVGAGTWLNEKNKDYFQGKWSL